MVLYNLLVVTPQAGSPFREPLIKFLTRHPSQTVELFMMEATLNDPQWSRMFMVCVCFLFVFFHTSYYIVCLCLKNPFHYILNVMLSYMNVAFSSTFFHFSHLQSFLKHKDAKPLRDVLASNPNRFVPLLVPAGPATTVRPGSPSTSTARLDLQFQAIKVGQTLS